MSHGHPALLYGLNVLPVQCLLLQQALADWPRRSAPMLMVNCRAGEFLPFLWQAGFDLVATETNGKLRERAARRPVPGLGIRAADDTDLPFENETFDWTIVQIMSGNREHLEKTSREALRVSRRGIMFLFWNNASLPLLYWRMLHHAQWPFPSAAWHRVWLTAKKLACGKTKSFAILSCPPGFCPTGKAFAWLNRQKSFLPFGAWAIVRIDFYPERPLTPMPLRVDSSFAEVEACTEWAHKCINNQNRDMNK